MNLLNTKITPEGARRIVYICLTLPAVVFAYRVSKLDRTDPFGLYSRTGNVNDYTESPKKS